MTVTLPSPPPLDSNLSVWEGLRMLETCYEQVLLNLDDPQYKASAARHVVHAMVGKDAAVAAQAKAFILACQELDRAGSPISPLVWTWWRVKSLVKRGRSPYSLKTVWSLRIKEPSLRRFFYEETSYSALSGRPLWPVAASQLVGLWRKLEAEVRPLEADAARKLWDSWEPSAKRLVKVGMEQKATIVKHINKHVAKLDLGMWLSPDLLSYLDIPKHARALTPVAPKRRTAR